ncbi:MAG: hypothetical protein WAW06_05325 [bacterium]
MSAVKRSRAAGKPRRRVKADAELVRKLKVAAAAGGPVEAVFMLRSPREKSAAAASAERTARTVLDRVAQSVGISAGAVSIFSSLGAFAVSADARFLRALLAEPEIKSAVANRRPEDLLIRPKRKRRVS